MSKGLEPSPGLPGCLVVVVISCLSNISLCHCPMDVSLTLRVLPRKILVSLV
jgi:hypothetical protein